MLYFRKCLTMVFIYYPQISYIRKKILGSLRTFQQDMLRVFREIWQTISILAPILIGE